MIKEKNILITGSSRGLGRALSERYVDKGWRVYGCSRGDSDFSHNLYRHIVADITHEPDVARLFSTISKDTGSLDILINNAGVKQDGMTLLSTMAQAVEMLQANFLGPYLVTRTAAKLMMRGRFGRVINISSMAIPLGSVGSGLYAAGKAATEQLARSLARELTANDITVNTLGISIYEDAGMVEQINPAALEKARAQLIKSGTLDIDEIVHAIDFLISPLAAKITNQTIYFGGVR